MALKDFLGEQLLGVLAAAAASSWRFSASVYTYNHFYLSWGEGYI